MSYYILPKISNTINVNPSHNNNVDDIYISFSLFNFYTKLKTQLVEMLNETNVVYDEIIKLVNPCEYIFSKVPGSNCSVSKLKTKTNLFYDFFEISKNFNIFENSNVSLYISPNYSDFIECFEIIKSNVDSKNIFYKNTDTFNDKDFENKKFDFIFYEITENKYNEYIISLINAVLIILKNQKFKGNIIVKISDTFHKPIIDIIYYLSSLYESVYIAKPSSSNITTFDKYIVCKNFRYNEQNNTYLKYNYYKLLIFIKKLDDKCISEILNFDIPYYFKAKLEEVNIIIGQQQLEAMDQIFYIYINKNKDKDKDKEKKIENLKKLYIQKSVSWCEKYKIPYNKFSEKINIFLPNEIDEIDEILHDNNYII